MRTTLADIHRSTWDAAAVFDAKRGKRTEESISEPLHAVQEWEYALWKIKALHDILLQKTGEDQPSSVKIPRTYTRVYRRGKTICHTILGALSKDSSHEGQVLRCEALRVLTSIKEVYQDLPSHKALSLRNLQKKTKEWDCIQRVKNHEQSEEQALTTNKVIALAKVRAREE